MLRATAFVALFTSVSTSIACGQAMEPDPSTPDSGGTLCSLPVTCEDIDLAKKEMSSHALFPESAEPYQVVCLSWSGAIYTLISSLDVFVEGQHLVESGQCPSADLPCRGSVHPAAVEADRRMELLFLLVTGHYAVVRYLPPGTSAHETLTNLMTGDWEIPSPWDIKGGDLTLFAGAEVEVEVGGRLLDVGTLAVHVRRDGIRIHDRATGATVVRAGTPSSDSPFDLEIEGASGRGHVFYRYTE